MSLNIFCLNTSDLIKLNDKIKEENEELSRYKIKN